MGNCCAGPPTVRANRWGEYSEDELGLYYAALVGDAARVTAILATPGVRPEGFRHARVRVCCLHPRTLAIASS